MSYVRHKGRAFRDDGDIPEVIRRRSEGRLKMYPSTEDARAWCGDIDDRRQQILDYVISDIEPCNVGKYVPIDVLINTLLANKNSDCGKLKEQVDELQKLLDMYSKLELTPEQKAKLNGMKGQVGKAGKSLSAVTDKSGGKSGDKPGGKSGAKSESGRDSCTAVKREEDPSCSALAAAGGGTPFSKPGTPGDEKDLKAMVINKDAEIIALKNQLAAKQVELDQLTGKGAAGQPTDGLKEVLQERDNLKKELQVSKHEIQSLRTRIDEPCIQEIEGLENEIRRLKSKGQLSADEEADIIRKEIDVLKKYCVKLATIQEENQNLKQQIDQLKTSGPGGLDPSSSLGPCPVLSGTPTAASTFADKDCSALRKELNHKIAKLNEMTAERDKLKDKVKKLENELIKNGNLPDDIETMRKKSQMLDSVSDECKKLRSSLENMKSVEEELKSLKHQASKAEQLQDQLDSAYREMQSIRQQSSAEIKTLKIRNEDVVRERESYKKMATEAKNMGEELKCLANCAKEAEALKRERDNLKSKLSKLGGIEAQFKQLQDKVKYLENIKSEREMYKMKYEEMLGLECHCEMLKAQVDKFKDMDRDRDVLLKQVRDCECCIGEQENEINKLICHIDNMSKGNTDQQSLNFEELKLLHNKTCEATAALLRKSHDANKNMQFTCPHMPTDDDRQRLIKRIAALENDLVKKEKHTQEKVGALQIAVRMERQRLQDFKSLLDTEKNRNNELMCKIGAQTRTVTNMQMEREVLLKKSSFNEEKLQSLVWHCEQEKARIKKLEEELSREKAVHKNEMQALYEIQMRAPSKSSYQQQPHRHCTCRHQGPNSRDIPEPENPEHCCRKKARHSCKFTPRSQSHLEEVD